MNVRAALAAACFALVPLVACSSDEAPAPPPRWSVARGAIRDVDGRTVVLRGANVASAHKQKPYLGTFGPADYVRLKDDWGFGAIRLLVSWAGLEPARDAWDDAYLGEIERRVGWARDAGLLVVVDMHQDLFGEGFGGDGAPRWACEEDRYAAFQPKTPWFLGYLDPNVIACFERLWTDDALRAQLVEGWRRLARRLATYENVIGFDVLNEPYWGKYAVLGFEPDRLAPFYEEVARAVREHAPSWLLFAEPSASRNVGYPTQLPKLGVSGVVYAPHAYDADAESGKGFDAAHREAFTRKIAELRAEADALGAALFLGEYGGNADQPGIAEYMDAAYDAAGAAAASSAYWAYDKDDGYGLLRPDGSEKKVLADVLARPYPSRVAGDLVSYAYDDATRTATIRFVPDRASRAPTEIVVPARVAPAGVDVDCGGCDVEQERGIVRLRTSPPGDPANVVVRAR